MYKEGVLPVGRACWNLISIFHSAALSTVLFFHEALTAVSRKRSCL